MRKQIDGLALLVQEAMELNPFDKALFVFGNRQRDKVKLLFWGKRSFRDVVDLLHLTKGA
jgi:transposase